MRVTFSLASSCLPNNHLATPDNRCWAKRIQHSANASNIFACKPLLAKCRLCGTRQPLHAPGRKPSSIQRMRGTFSLASSFLPNNYRATPDNRCVRRDEMDLTFDKCEEYLRLQAKILLAFAECWIIFALAHAAVVWCRTVVIGQARACR